MGRGVVPLCRVLMRSGVSRRRWDRWGALHPAHTAPPTPPRDCLTRKRMNAQSSKFTRREIGGLICAGAEPPGGKRFHSRLYIDTLCPSPIFPPPSPPSRRLALSAAYQLPCNFSSVPFWSQGCRCRRKLILWCDAWEMRRIENRREVFCLTQNSNVV